MPWFHFWAHLIALAPTTFACLSAVVESLIALALLFGLARQVTCLAAAAVRSAVKHHVPAGGVIVATEPDDLAFAGDDLPVAHLEHVSGPPLALFRIGGGWGSIWVYSS